MEAESKESPDELIARFLIRGATGPQQSPSTLRQVEVIFLGHNDFESFPEVIS